MKAVILLVGLWLMYALGYTGYEVLVHGMPMEMFLDAFLFHVNPMNFFAM